MEVSVRNLVSRSGKFQFRYRLPVKYSSRKSREIRVSLRTQDLKKAIRVCTFGAAEPDGLMRLFYIHG